MLNHNHKERGKSSIEHIFFKLYLPTSNDLFTCSVPVVLNTVTFWFVKYRCGYVVH